MRKYLMRAGPTAFFTLWKDADPDIPILKEAMAEHAKLQLAVREESGVRVHGPTIVSNDLGEITRGLRV